MWRPHRAEGLTQAELIKALEQGGAGNSQDLGHPAVGDPFLFEVLENPRVDLLAGTVTYLGPSRTGDGGGVASAGADKAYDSREFRGCLWRKGIKPMIPPIEGKQPKRGRPVRVGPGYRERWKVERLGYRKP